MNASVRENGEVARLVREIRSGNRVVSISGLTSPAAKAYVLVQAQAAAAKSFVVVTDSNSTLDTFECDLDFWRAQTSGSVAESSGESRFSTRNLRSAILGLPSFETDVYSGVSPHAETEERRAMTLWRLV